MRDLYERCTICNTDLPGIGYGCPACKGDHFIPVGITIGQVDDIREKLRQCQSEVISLRALHSEVESRLKTHRYNLADWESGYLAPTEPDPDERQAVMERLKVAIHVLSDVLAFAE